MRLPTLIRPVCFAAAFLALYLAGTRDLAFASEDRQSPSSQSATSQAAKSDAPPLNAEETCDKLVKAAAGEKEPGAKFGAHLDAARCLLQTNCAVELSRELATNTDHSEQLRDAASKALEQLKQAADALDHSGLTEDAKSDAVECVDMLKAFASMFRALGLPPTAGAAREELLSACGGLAGYFDDSRAGIAEAAKLWQGVAYRRAGKPDRALQVLRPALSVPTARRVGFWERLERCRALKDKGDYAAAVALSLRLSTRADAWFEEEDKNVRQQAVDSLRWLRIELLRDWARHLEETGQKDRAKEITADADRVLGSDTLPAPADRWLSIGPPIPDLPDCRRESTTRPDR